MGGTYVPSVTAKYEETVTLVSGEGLPTRKGYRFEGWYLDENCIEKAGKTLKLESDTRVYAKWIGDWVDYKIVYMTENADDEGYSYVDTVTARAQAGTKVQATADSLKPNKFDTDHFTFKESTEEVVAADGSTVIIAYYTRNEYTITFKGTWDCGKEEHEHSHGFLGIGGCYDWHNNLICGKEEHNHKQAGCSVRTITAKHGAYIGDDWITAVGSDTPYGTWQWKWQSSSDSKWTAYQEIMPDKPMNLDHRDTAYEKKRILQYYIEDPKGSESFKEKNFTLKREVKLRWNGSPTFNEEFVDMLDQGYDRYGSTIKVWEDGQSNGHMTGSYSSGQGPYKFYYSRHEYELNLISNGKDHISKHPYLSDISDKLNTPPASTGDETFDGWYFDPNFTQKYNGDYTMPKGLVLYAKWNPKTYTVTFADSMREDKPYAIEKVAASKTVTFPEEPIKSGYHFDGWFEDINCKIPFDPAKQIEENITIYAKWKATTIAAYTVRHMVGDVEIFKEEFTDKVGKTVVGYSIDPGKKNPQYKGYIPDKISDSLVLGPDSSQNVITFNYKSVQDLSYNVVYKLEELDGEAVYSESGIPSHANYIKVVANTNKLVELGYKIKAGEASSKMVTLTTGKNEVVFLVEKAVYEITYELDGGTLPAGESNPSTYTPADLTDEGITLVNPEKSGHTFTGWKLTNGTVAEGEKHDAMNTVISKGSYGDLTFTATYEQSTSSYTVEYYYDDIRGNAPAGAPTKGTGVIGDTVNVDPPAMADVNEKHYVLESENHRITINADEAQNVIRVDYALDENGNNIPDEKEQRYEIVYKVGDGGTASTEEFEIKSDILPDTMVDKLPTRSGDFITWGNDGAIISPNSGYKFKDMVVSYESANGENVSGEGYAKIDWNPQDPKVVSSIQINNASEDDLSPIAKVIVTVNYEKDDTKWTSVTFNRGAHGTFTGDPESQQKIHSDLLINNLFPNPPDITADDGWIFAGWAPDLPVLVTQGDQVYIAQYKEDKNGNEIPDEKEQRYKIIYKANDGGIGEIEAYDNLLPDTPITNLPTRAGNTVSFKSQKITAKAGYKFVGMTVTCDPDTYEELLTYKTNGAGDVSSIKVANFSIDNTGIKEVIVTVNYEVDPEAKLNYTVEYYKDSVLEETESKEVQEANPVVTLESLKKDVSDETSGYYAYQFESANPDPDSQGSFTITDNATIKLYYVKDESKTKDLYYLVNHWIDGEADPEITIRATEKVWYGAGNFLNRQPEAEKDQGYEGYAKDRVTYMYGKEVTGDTIGNGAVVIVHYLPDTNGDQIPDKYQKKVTFNVVHGQWGAVEEGGTAPIEKWITLVDGSGKWSENGSYTLTEEDVPFAGNYPDSGYKAGKWDPIPVGQEITPDSDNLEYTYSYEKDDTQTREVSYTVNHVHVSENGTEEVFSVQTVSDRVWVEENPARIDIWPITLRNGDGWAYDRNTVSGEEAPLLTNWDGTILEGKARTILENGVITVYYEKDGNGDNIPDKYQKKVTFKVEHGQWNEAEGKGYDPIERWITLVDESGKWDDNGSYTLKETDVPSVGNQPDPGYMAGIWRTHPANKVIGPDTENAEYTYYYLPDENQTKDLTYTVNHYKVDSEGNEILIGEPDKVKETVWENKVPEELEVQDIDLRNGDGWTYDWNQNNGGTTNPLQPDEAREKLLGEGTVLHGSEIIVYYAEDENNDNIPDKYQKKVTFKVEHGQWNVAEGKGYDPIERWITLVDESGEWSENGSYTLKETDVPSVGNEPDPGYMAGIWRNHPANEVIGPNTENAEYTYYYLPDENQTKNLTYTVNHYKVDSEGNEILIGEPDKVKETVWENADQADLAVKDIILKEEAGYAYVRYEAPEGTSFKLDESLTKLIGEGKIADQGIISVYYSEDENDDNVPDEHQIIFTYVSAGNGTVEGTVTEVHTFRDGEGNYTKPAEVSPKADVTITPAEGYTFDFWDDTEGNDFTPNMEHLKKKTYGTDTTFTVHFDKDEIGTDPTDPNKPDNVPDKYQITFRYVSEDNNHGTVNGIVTEVRTVYEAAEGEQGYQTMEKKAVNPNADVTVTEIGNYRFNGWNDGTNTYANTDAVKAEVFDHDATFTATFTYEGGGGGGSTGGGRYTPDDGGPGAVTIAPEEVPLASLPEGMGPVIIGEDEVPLAPLPKTGQTTMRSTLTMMLSGILVAIMAVGKKRKEED